MKTLIIIPTKDRPKALNRLLSSLSNSDHTCDIVVMMDERTPKLRNNKKISNKFDSTYITHKVNGLNNIYNLGIKENPNFERYIFFK